MTTRREFLGEGIAVSALSMTAGQALAAAVTSSSDGHPSLSISKIVFDRDFHASRAFAAQATRLGLPTHGISGDVTALWYDDLDRRWRTDPHAVAGLTGISSLFCLEQLARRDDRRVMLRIEHLPAGSGVVEHRLQGAEGLRARVARMTRTASWPLEMARLVKSGAVTATAGAAARSLPGPAGPVDDWVEPLVTWVIAPRRTA